VKALLEHANPEIVNAATIEGGATALHMACERGHLEIANLLVQSGANIAAPAGCGLLPIQIALTCKHSSIVELLKTGPEPVSAIVTMRIRGNNCTKDEHFQPFYKCNECDPSMNFCGESPEVFC
jgi:ankyrin repeat protein